MERSDKLLPGEVRFFIGELKRIINNDRAKYVALAQSLANFTIEYINMGLMGNQYKSLVDHMNDYVWVIDCNVQAGDLALIHLDMLDRMIGNSDLIGEEIFDELNRIGGLLTNAWSDSREWEHQAQTDSSLRNNPYTDTIDTLTTIKQMWEDKKITFDTINAGSSGLFADEVAAFATAQAFLDEIVSRPRNGINIVIDPLSPYKAQVLATVEDLKDKKENIDLFADIHAIESMDQIEAFWLTDPMFKDDLWYYDPANVAKAAEYLRRQIQLEGAFDVRGCGEMTPEERIIYQRMMVFINNLANIDATPYFNDHTLDGFENSCSRYEEVFADLGGYENGICINEQILEILIRNKDERYFEEFGKWYAGGGHYYFDALFLIGDAISPTASLNEGLATGYEGLGIAIQYSEEIPVGTDPVYASLQYYNEHM